MSKSLVIFIIGLIIACIGLTCFAYIEHTNRVKAEQQVATLTLSNQNLQEYIKEKDKAYEDLTQKYKKLRDTKPVDTCGDSVVSEDILNWLRNR